MYPNIYWKNLAVNGVSTVCGFSNGGVVNLLKCFVLLTNIKLSLWC